MASKITEEVGLMGELHIYHLERTINSLQLELNAEKHCHLKDNEYLLTQRNGLRNLVENLMECVEKNVSRPAVITELIRQTRYVLEDYPKPGE